MVFLLNSAQLNRGCLKDLWDGLLLSKMGSALVGFSISTNSSPQSEELHQQLSWVPTHFSQYSPVKFCLFPSTLFNSSSSVWEILAAYSGSITTLGGIQDLHLLVHQFLNWYYHYYSQLPPFGVSSSFWYVHYSCLLCPRSSTSPCKCRCPWNMVYLPHLVLIFTSTSSALSGILQNKYPSRSQVAFRVFLSAILKFKILFVYYS